MNSMPKTNDPISPPSNPPSWTPPFCSRDTHLTCPVCKAPYAVRVREKEMYFDTDAVEAYCADCHADLEVQSSVTIDFSDPEEVTP